MAAPGLGDILNSKVSLVTNSNIRYEGTAIHIAQEEKKITLQAVKQFGTEGRNAEIGAPEIPAPPDEQNSFPYVEFAITMIKQLKVIEKAPEAFKDPAIEVKTEPPAGVKKEEPRRERVENSGSWKETRREPKRKVRYQEGELDKNENKDL